MVMGPGDDEAYEPLVFLSVVLYSTWEYFAQMEMSLLLVKCCKVSGGIIVPHLLFTVFAVSYIGLPHLRHLLGQARSNEELFWMLLDISILSKQAYLTTAGNFLSNCSSPEL